MPSSGRIGTTRLAIAARLLAAYRRSTYVVAGIAFQPGRRSAALDDWLRHACLRQAALITAWNPRSRRMPPAWNHRMQRRLLERLRRVQTHPAQSGTGRWREAQVLAGIGPHRAAVLGRRFRQAAIVLLRRGLAPRLLQPHDCPHTICRATANASPIP